MHDGTKADPFPQGLDYYRQLTQQGVVGPGRIRTPLCAAGSGALRDDLRPERLSSLAANMAEHGAVSGLAVKWR